MSASSLRFTNVEVGQEPPSITKGPWTTAHIIRWHIAQENLERLHYDQRYATEVLGLPNVVANGNWRKYCLAQLCKDWVGHDGWVWKLAMRYTRMQFPGDVLTVWGRVVHKYEAEGLGVVELEGGMRNQDGVETTPSYMVVALPLEGGRVVPYPFIPPKSQDTASPANPFSQGKILPEPLYVTEAVYRNFVSGPPSEEIECWDEVNRSDLRRMALAIPDPDPLYWDEGFARKTRFGGIVAPPVYPVEAFRVPPNWPDELTEVAQRDPNFFGAVGDPRFRSGRASSRIHPDLTVTLNGGQEYEIFRLLHLGEKCKAQSRPVDIFEKQGKSGRFVVTVSKTEYRTLPGELIMVARQYGVSAPKGVGSEVAVGDAVPVV